MPQLHAHEPSRLFKTELSQLLHQNDSYKQSCTHSLRFNFHGVPIALHFETKQQADELRSFLPNHWIDVSTKPHEVYWLQAKNQGMDQTQFHDDADAELELRYIDKSEVAIQRDFLGMVKSDHSLFVCDASVSDGFFNAWRWLLPRYLVQKQAYLLHSCGVVAPCGEATLFIGPSGAGKSTVASLAKDHLILGDDCIIVTKKDGEYYVETGAIGQNPNFLGPIGETFRLKHVYFINQAAFNRRVPIKTSEASRRLIREMIYPGWHSIDMPTSQLVFAWVSEFVQNTVPNRLDFNLTIDLKEYTA